MLYRLSHRIEPTNTMMKYITSYEVTIETDTGFKMNVYNKAMEDVIRQFNDTFFARGAKASMEKTIIKEIKQWNPKK